MTPRPRVGFLGVYHESNTFASKATGLQAFTPRWYRGQELIDTFQATRSVGGGFIDGARDNGLQLVPLFATYATPSGPVTRAAFDRIIEEFRVALTSAGPIDGILLEIHGDLVVEGIDDAEETVVDLIRRHLPGVPISAVLDLHANFSKPRLQGIDVLIGYRTNPHIDTYERGWDAAGVMASVLLSGRRFHRAHRGLPIVAAPAAQSTSREPMSTLMAHAEHLRFTLDLTDVTVHAGYAYADRSYTGMGFSATVDHDRAADADRAVSELLQIGLQSAPSFQAELLEPSDAIRVALAATSPGSPAAVADTGDNINAGAPGDSTWLLHEARLERGPRFATTIADPVALALACRAGEGAVVPMSIGGRASPLSGEPIRADARVMRITDGSFENVGPMATGTRVHMGGAAWVQFDNLDVLVQGSACQPNDPAMLRSLGMDIEGVSVLLLKGAAALRAGWEPLVSTIIDAATPGETDSLVARLQYRLSPAVPAASYGGDP